MSTSKIGRMVTEEEENGAPYKEFMYFYLQKYSSSTGGVPCSVLDVGTVNKNNRIAALLGLYSHWGGKIISRQNNFRLQEGF
jgi:hypothetical protein